MYIYIYRRIAGETKRWARKVKVWVKKLKKLGKT
jgi:hypothetical protein